MLLFLEHGHNEHCHNEHCYVAEMRRAEMEQRMRAVRHWLTRPLRNSPMRVQQHWLTQPLRRVPMPILAGNGRGLRVRVGESVIRVATRLERRVEDSFLGLLSPGDVFYDIGANIGWYSLLAARAVGPDGRVFAFEPLLENARYAQRNAQTNGLENMTVVPAAVTDENGWVTLLVRGSLMSRLEKDDSEAQAERRRKRNIEFEGRRFVPATTLDSWLAETGQPAPTIVKIDVEGAETGVLRGMRETLATAKPVLIIELHATQGDVAAELDRAGYQHSAIETDDPTRQAPNWAHILAMPAGHPARV